MAVKEWDEKYLKSANEKEAKKLKDALAIPGAVRVKCGQVRNPLLSKRRELVAAAKGFVKCPEGSDFADWGKVADQARTHLRQWQHLPNGKFPLRLGLKESFDPKHDSTSSSWIFGESANLDSVRFLYRDIFLEGRAQNKCTGFDEMEGIHTSYGNFLHKDIKPELFGDAGLEGGEVITPGLMTKAYSTVAFDIDWGGAIARPGVYEG